MQVEAGASFTSRNVCNLFNRFGSHELLYWDKKMVIFYVYSKSFQSEYQLTTVSACKWTSKLCQRVQQSFEYLILSFWSFPCGLAVKTSACNAGELGSIHGLGRSPGEGKGNLLQYSGLENSWSLGEFRGLYSPWGRRVGHDWATHFLSFLAWIFLRS